MTGQMTISPTVAPRAPRSNFPSPDHRGYSNAGSNGVSTPDRISRNNVIGGTRGPRLVYRITLPAGSILAPLCVPQYQFEAISVLGPPVTGTRRKEAVG